jgi:Ca2+-binding RTX toxin-like protein
MTLTNSTIKDVLDTNTIIDFTQADEIWTVAKGINVTVTSDFAARLDNDDDHLVNRGHILATQEKAVFLTEDRDTVLNTVGASIIGYGAGVELAGARDLVTNHGLIDSVIGYGVQVISPAVQANVINTGEISGALDGVLMTGADGGAVHNRAGGFIRGGQYGIDVDTGLQQTTLIANAAHATITGKMAAIHSSVLGGVTLLNSGVVAGAVDLDAVGNDVIINHGKIKGAVHLGVGIDSFDGKGGISGQIFGEAGNDTLLGGARGDRIHGGDGNDLLTGRAGADRFFFDTTLNAATNVDRITDFKHGVDKIVLSALDFAGIGGPGVLGAGQFFAGAGAHDVNDHIIYNPNNGFLSYDSNGNAPGGVTHFATLAHHLDLHNTDFVVIA